ncbi:MAG: cytochrome c biogenesis protein ResB [bacterium]
MATDTRSMEPGSKTEFAGLGLFDLLFMAWVDFLHIIQQLKFGIFLLLVIAIMTLIGASVPQAAFGDTPADYLQWYTPTQYKWIVQLGLDRIFHTGYFLGCLALLVISVTLCAFGRLFAAQRLMHNTKPHTSLSELEGSRFNGYLELPGKTIGQAMVDFKNHRYTTFTREGNQGEIQVLVRRGLSAKWANVSMHFAFIVMATGALIGVSTQLKNTNAAIGEGEVFIQQDTGQRIRCKEYFQEYSKTDFPTPESLFTNGFPTDFKSTLQVLDEDGNILKEKTIEVNDPLIVDGVYYYQQSFVQLPAIRVQTPGGFDTVVSPQPGQPILYPFFSQPVLIDKSGAVVGGYWLKEDGSRGEVMPFQVKILEGRPAGTSGGHFYHPMKALANGEGVLIEDVPQTIEGPSGQVTLTLKGVREATILQVKRDRGINIMYFAFGVVVFGIMYPLFWPYHDGRFLLQETPEGKLRIWWGSRYRAGRRNFGLLTRYWLGQKVRAPEEDLVGDFKA